MSILWGLSLLLHQRAQAQGCLVKRKGGRKEKRKERGKEGRKEGERDFLEGSLGIKTFEQEKMPARYGGSKKPQAP